MMFGKRLSEYLAFQKWFLAAIGSVGIVRLVLSMAGVPHANTAWLSVSLVWLAGFFYYAIAVHFSGFGGHKHVLPLLLNQTVLAQALIIAGIAIAILTGQDNIYSAAEFTRGGLVGRSWTHAAAHLAGVVVYPLLGWLLSWPILAVARRLAPRTSARQA